MALCFKLGAKPSEAIDIFKMAGNMQLNVQQHGNYILHGIVTGISSRAVW